MPKLTQWFSTNEFGPICSGWYEVKHEKGTWISGRGYAHWDGKEWRRNFGWPSLKNERAWTIVDGVLKLPISGSHLSNHAYALSCSSVVNVLEFRGFVPE